MTEATGSEEASTLVRKLWQYCNVLRDDGLSYPDYVEQLTYLLFLKMAGEDESQHLIPVKYSWHSFAELESNAMQIKYSQVLTGLSREGGMLGLIFQNARCKIRDSAKLRLLVSDLIGVTRWTGLSPDVKGDAYEGLLDKNARDTKSGAGQYFTPRPLVEAIVECIDPSPGEVVCDPACGTGGFLLAAHRHIVESYDLDRRQLARLRNYSLRGVELVDEVARLAAMNLFLHGIGGLKDDQLPIARADSLAVSPRSKVDVILTNPPFGVKGSMTYSKDGRTRKSNADLDTHRPDFFVTTANKQLNFVQHAMSMLKPSGRAALVLPDNVLYEDGAAVSIRRHLLESCTLRAILRLPSGLFYAHGVTANVIFFDRRKPTISDESFLVYDLRSGLKRSLKSNPISKADLTDFVATFRSMGESIEESGPRWRMYGRREVLATDNCGLDLSWSEADSVATSAMTRLNELSRSIASDLQQALISIQEAAN